MQSLRTQSLRTQSLYTQSLRTQSLHTQSLQYRASCRASCRASVRRGCVCRAFIHRDTEPLDFGRLAVWYIWPAIKSWLNGAIFRWGDILVRRILDVGGLVRMAHHTQDR